MTADKDWKRLVRERMAKTGESYTAARAQLRAQDLRATPAHGRTAETAALARAFAALGVRGPQGQGPLSEALLFGIGGGIGMAYFVFEYKLAPEETWVTLYLGGRINPYVQRSSPGAAKDAEFLDVACARAGLPASITQSASPQAAEKQLRAALGAGRQVIAMVDEAQLPHGMPKTLAGMVAYPVGVTLAGESPAIVDLDARPQAVSWPELARLRGSVKSAKHRLLVLGPPPAPVDLARAVRAGIAETSRGLLEPPMKNFGLAGLGKWAELVGDTRDPKGWPKLFHDGRRLAQALKWVAHWLVGPGSDGNFLRGLYADFLEEAAVLLDRAPLAAVAAQYRALGEEWAALAAAVLPRSIPQLEPICSLLAFKRCLLERHGPGTADELREIESDLGTLEQELERSPLSDGDIRALQDELRGRILHLCEGETRAARALAAA